MRNKALLFAAAMLLICIFVIYHKRDNYYVPVIRKLVAYQNYTHEWIDHINTDPGTNVFFVIICSKKNGADNLNKDQMKQFSVMLKSAAMLTRTSLRFDIIADSTAVQESISALTAAWPEEYSRRLQFRYHELAYPPGYERIRNMYLPCATQRLFLPDMFPELDAAVYVDTDVIFLRRPEELWEEFFKFDAMQLAAIGPTSFYRLANLKVPYYPPGGLNPGIMMMNLTRMRQYPLGIPIQGGWSSAMLGVVNEYHNRLEYADMDILNIFFNKNPNLLYPLGCWWNFLMTHCKSESPCLPHMVREDAGVAILHGAGDVFMIGDKENKMKVVFETIVNHSIATPIDELVSTLKSNLRASKVTKNSDCDKVRNIDTLLTIELEKKAQ